MNHEESSALRALTLVCFAVKEEAVFVRPWAGARPDLKLLVTGMGKKNTEAAILRALTGNSPALVLTCGFAGGLDPALKSGDLVFETDGSLALREALAEAGARASHFHCSESVAVTVESKQRLRQETGADVVEMESAIIRAIAREKGIPSATLRVILDAAGEDLPLDFNQLMTPGMKLHPLKLAMALAKAPGRIPALIRFQKQSQFAARALSQGLQVVLAHKPL
jgi:adenosylhomocysteine nucleosidase